jgi:hypothetical protein
MVKLSDEEKKERKRVANKKYYQENREEIARQKKISGKKYRQNNKEKEAARNKRWRDKNPEKARENSRVSSKKHRDANPEYKKEYYDKNKEKLIEYTKEWQKNNKGTVNAKTAKYRANKTNATSMWADLEAIKEFYKQCPAGFEVDHIVPLQSDSVCGLHVENNLQYLTKSENRRKRNKLIDTAD